MLYNLSIINNTFDLSGKRKQYDSVSSCSVLPSCFISLRFSMNWHKKGSRQQIKYSSLNLKNSYSTYTAVLVNKHPTRCMLLLYLVSTYRNGPSITREQLKCSWWHSVALVQEDNDQPPSPAAHCEWAWPCSRRRLLVMMSLGKTRRQSSQGPQTPGCQEAETGTALHTER